MTDSFYTMMTVVWATLSGRFWDVAAYPVSSDHRLFWVYLMTSALFALFVYRKTWPRRDGETP